jgi:hypothetical protein
MTTGQSKRLTTRSGEIAYIHTVQKESGDWIVYTTGAATLTFPPQLHKEERQSNDHAYSLLESATFPTQLAAEETARQALQQGVFEGDPIESIEPIESA